MNDFVFRSEPAVAPDGTRLRVIYRRRLLGSDSNRCHLGEVERAVVVEGRPAAPDWEQTGGLLGRGCWLSRDRMKTCGYSDRAPREVISE